MPIAQGTAYFYRPVRESRDSQPQHVVDAVALLGVQVFKCLGHQAGVSLQQCGPVTLDGPQTLCPTLDGGEFLPGGLTRFFQGIQLGSEFVEGDKASGGHVLEVGTSAVRLYQTVEPDGGLYFWITVLGSKLPSHHLVEPFPQGIRIQE